MKMSKPEFLRNVRVAKNLYGNQRVTADSPAVNIAESGKALSCAAIWLTPKSVEHFNAADFPELGEKQAALQDSVLAFRTIAKEIPRDEPATNEQLGNAKVAFERVLEIIEPYLPTPEEGKSVEAALAGFQYPNWVITWNYELGSDEDGTAAMWLNVYADEETAPRGKLGLEAARLTQELRKRLTEARITRWPYVRLRSGQKHKAQ
jgi:hypothetical protein